MEEKTKLLKEIWLTLFEIDSTFNEIETKLVLWKKLAAKLKEMEDK